MRHLLSLFDLTTDEIKQILTYSLQLKAELAEGNRHSVLASHNLATCCLKSLHSVLGLVLNPESVS